MHLAIKRAFKINNNRNTTYYTPFPTIVNCIIQIIHIDYDYTSTKSITIRKNILTKHYCHLWGYFIDPLSELRPIVINYEIWIMVTFMLVTARDPVYSLVSVLVCRGMWSLRKSVYSWFGAPKLCANIHCLTHTWQSIVRYTETK